MKGLNLKFVMLIATAGLLSACGSSATATPASQSPVAAIVSTVAATEAPTSTQAAATTAVSFAKDIQPLLGSRCVNCHGGDRTEKGLILKTYADIMKGSENGPVVVAGNADQSKLAEMILNGKMPKRGPKLTPPEIKLIVDWINQGALNN